MLFPHTGTAYSMPLGEIMRWKRFPAIAAACIFVVRGFVVQVGFHEHMRTAAGNVTPIPPWFESPTNMFAVVFFTSVGVGIALFKDVPVRIRSQLCKRCIRLSNFLVVLMLM